MFSGIMTVLSACIFEYNSWSRKHLNFHSPSQEKEDSIQRINTGDEIVWGEVRYSLYSHHFALFTRINLTVEFEVPNYRSDNANVRIGVLNKEEFIIRSTQSADEKIIKRFKKIAYISSYSALLVNCEHLICFLILCRWYSEQADLEQSKMAKLTKKMIPTHAFQKINQFPDELNPHIILTHPKKIKENLPCEFEIRDVSFIPKSTSDRSIVLLGAPNSGKTCIINLITNTNYIQNQEWASDGTLALMSIRCTTRLLINSETRSVSVNIYDTYGLKRSGKEFSLRSIEQMLIRWKITKLSILLVLTKNDVITSQFVHLTEVTNLTEQWLCNWGIMITTLDTPREDEKEALVNKITEKIISLGRRPPIFIKCINIVAETVDCLKTTSNETKKLLYSFN